MAGYYVPNRAPFPGTIGLVEGSVGPISYMGEVRDIVVASDWGRRVYFFSQGSLALETVIPTSWPRAIDVLDRVVFYGVEDYLMARSFPAGAILGTYALANPHQGGKKHINAIQFSRYMGKTFLTVCYDFIGPNSVIVYEFADDKFVEFLSCPYVVSYPRGGYFTGVKLVVADTFGPDEDGLGTVFMTDGITKETIANVYFPNTVYPMPNGNVLICAEHENRVYEGHPESGQKILHMSCGHHVFSRIENPSTHIAEFQGLTASHKVLHPQKSICSVEHGGPRSLYSPNSARMYGDDLLIADTDNNRVIVKRKNEIVTSVTGFNNPVTAVFVQ